MRIPIRTGAFVVSFREHGLAYRVSIGGVDPSVADTGPFQRLQNLGYGMSPLLALGVASGHYAPNETGQRKRLLCAFQLNHGLTATGTLDHATLDAIEKAHGS